MDDRSPRQTAPSSPPVLSRPVEVLGHSGPAWAAHSRQWAGQGASRGAVAMEHADAGRMGLDWPPAMRCGGCTRSPPPFPLRSGRKRRGLIWEKSPWRWFTMVSGPRSLTGASCGPGDRIRTRSKPGEQPGNPVCGKGLAVGESCNVANGSNSSGSTTRSATSCTSRRPPWSHPPRERGVNGGHRRCTGSPTADGLRFHGQPAPASDG
jgi:hypothetical protein